MEKEIKNYDSNDVCIGNGIKDRTTQTVGGDNEFILELRDKELQHISQKKSELELKL